VVKKDKKFSEIFINKKHLFEKTQLLSDFVNPNIYENHIVFGNFNADIQKRALNMLDNQADNS